MSAIEALKPILEHVYTGHPPSASTLLPLYLAHPSPRSSLIYLPSTNPPTLLFSVLQDRLLFFSPCSVDTDPLFVLEFIHRVADALEEFLGSPLLASKIENSYDVVAQVLAEMCDGGSINTTEANVLRDVVETSTWMGKLLGGVGLPSSSPALNASSSAFALQKPSLPPTTLASGTAIPWRRSNVRHTSNELYVDIVETLSVTLAPSGRPLSAFANGSIAFTCKVSGVPELLLTLTTPSGRTGVERSMQLPVFHPCVRLARWREQPGTLSFVPPDGRFVLAGYEVDLLGDQPLTTSNKSKVPNLNLPATVSVQTGLGSYGADFEVRLNISTRFVGNSSGLSSSAMSSLSNNLNRPSASRAASGDAKTPVVENLVVSIPIPPTVRNISDLRPSKGEAHWDPGDGALEWRLAAKEVASVGSAGAVLRCTVVGPAGDEDVEDAAAAGMTNLRVDTYDYDESGAYQSSTPDTNTVTNGKIEKDVGRVKQNAVLMPTSATVSFSVKGWLPSGIKVDSLNLDIRKSKGLGEGVRPYKGVKYLTVSRGGVEARC
ncbi:hypothetical protein LTR50_001555 [Elasticomyces elasticus]|nr:hypothetical protein LTR50_001555 [Elasticomyces elasticus]